MEREREGRGNTSLISSNSCKITFFLVDPIEKRVRNTVRVRVMAGRGNNAPGNRLAKKPDTHKNKNPPEIVELCWRKI